MREVVHTLAILPLCTFILPLIVGRQHGNVRVNLQRVQISLLLLQLWCAGLWLVVLE